MMNVPGTVTYQPPGLADAPGSNPVNGVTIRYLRNNLHDAEFAAGLLVEAFKGKFVHNITEQKLPIAKRMMTTTNMKQNDDFYRRTLVAEYQGSSVGVCQIKFKDSKEDEEVENICELGCWHACRFTCFGIFSSSSVDDRSKCYVSFIGVDSMIRGKGVGKLLLERADYEARLRGCRKIFLYVTTDNRAKGLYERMGYTVTDRTTGCCGCLHCCIGPPGSIYEMEKML